MSDGQQGRVYRPERGIDPMTRRLALIAGAIGAVLLLMVGGWSLSGHHSGTIPVFEPLPGPIKVKPVNPGGLQLNGADPPPLTDAGDGGAGREVLAPGPEQADPARLRAELARAAPSAATPAAASSPAGATASGTPAPGLPAPGTPASGIPAPVTPAPGTHAGVPGPATPPVAALPPAPASPPAPSVAAGPAAANPATAVAAPDVTAPAPRGSGHVEVQLAAMDSRAAAEAEWERLSRKAPALFADRTSLIVEASRDGHAFWRLRTGGFATIAEATGFCDSVRATHAACTLASF